MSIYTRDNQKDKATYPLIPVTRSKWILVLSCFHTAPLQVNTLLLYCSITFFIHWDTKLLGYFQFQVCIISLISLSQVNLWSHKASLKGLWTWWMHRARSQPIRRMRKTFKLQLLHFLHQEHFGCRHSTDQVSLITLVLPALNLFYPFINFSLGQAVFSHVLSQYSIVNLGICPQKSHYSMLLNNAATLWRFILPWL